MGMKSRIERTMEELIILPNVLPYLLSRVLSLPALYLPRNKKLSVQRKYTDQFSAK